MEPLRIDATTTTPEVLLNATEGSITISGVSDEEDALGFYFPIIQWLDAYQHKPAPETSLTIRLKYFNTASAKALYEIVKRVANVRKGKHTATVRWYYDQDDPVLKDDIEHFCDIVTIPIQLVPHQD